MTGTAERNFQRGSGCGGTDIFVYSVFRGGGGR